VQHAVLPTTLPVRRFYEEFTRTIDVLNRKHLGWQAVRDVFGILVRTLARGQTNFLRMLWRFRQVYDVDRLVADHGRPVVYPMALPPDGGAGAPARDALYVHRAAAVAAADA